MCELWCILLHYHDSTCIAVRCFFLVLWQERDKAQAFRAIGMMAYAVGTKINTYLDPIVQAIKQSLPTKESGTAASR